MRLNYPVIIKSILIVVGGFMLANLIGYAYIRFTLEQHLADPNLNLTYTTSEIVIKILNMVIIYGSLLIAGYYIGKNGIKSEN